MNTCNHCNSNLELRVRPPSIGNQIIGLCLLAFGFLASLSIIGALLGIPIMIVGYRIGTTGREVERCPQCEPTVGERGVRTIEAMIRTTASISAAAFKGFWNYLKTGHVKPQHNTEGNE